MRPIEDCADLIILDEFRIYQKGGLFIPYDGCGYYATETEQSDISIWSKAPQPEWVTHVAWFNR